MDDDTLRVCSTRDIGPSRPISPEAVIELIDGLAAERDGLAAELAIARVDLEAARAAVPADGHYRQVSYYMHGMIVGGETVKVEDALLEATVRLPLAAGLVRLVADLDVARAEAAGLGTLGDAMVAAVGALDNHFGVRGSTNVVARLIRGVLNAVDAWDRARGLRAVGPD